MMLRKLLNYFWGDPDRTPYPTQLELMKEFLSVMDLAVLEKKVLTVIIEANGKEAGVMLCGGGENKLVEYMYNYAASAKLAREGVLEAEARSCPACATAADGCQLGKDKRYPCKYSDMSVSDAEAAHVG